MLPFPWEGRKRNKEIWHLRPLLLPDLHADHAYAIKSYALDTFRRWEWDLRRHTGFLGNEDMDYGTSLEDM
jgi:hypothetical protein